MVELIDNISQFAVTFLAGIGAGIMFYKTHKQTYFLLTCFYGTYMLGSLHWTLYILLFKYTPQVFYVSELAWIASFVFLLTLDFTLFTPKERKFHHIAAWIAPAICIPIMVFFMTRGEILGNLIMCGTTMVAAWLSIRGLIYARRQNDESRNQQFFHIAVLAIVILEYGLWMASCFWVSDTLTNPYFWFDFLLSAALLILLPATRKAVEL